MELCLRGGDARKGEVKIFFTGATAGARGAASVSSQKHRWNAMVLTAMPPPPTQVLDTVALVADLPELGLLAGEVGSVVERLGGDVFEVEFVNEAGRTYGLHTLEAWQLLRLHSQGLALKILNE